MSSKRNPRKAAAKRAPDPGPSRSPLDELAEPLAVSLRHSRSRHIIWLAFCVPLGAVLVASFGTVGQWLGAILLAVAAYYAYQLTWTLLHPPGDIEIGTDDVVLPRGLCRGNPIKAEVGKLRHAYLLRRAIPWSTTGPVLIVEVADHLLSYPRDWFTSESEQRRVALTINARLGRIEE